MLDVLIVVNVQTSRCENAGCAESSKEAACGQWGESRGSAVLRGAVRAAVQEATESLCQTLGKDAASL